MQYKKLLNDLDDQLEFLETETEGVLEKAEEGIKIARRALEQLRMLTAKHKFKNPFDEIHFFKHIKPQVYSKLIYYVKLFNIESKRPRSSSKSQIKYFNKHIDRLQNYFNDNLQFYHYYRRGATFLDEQYFLRGKADIRLFPESFAFFSDDKFATSHPDFNRKSSAFAELFLFYRCMRKLKFYKIVPEIITALIKTTRTNPISLAPIIVFLSF